MAGNYLKSLQLAKQLEERAKEATRNRGRAEKDFEKLQSFLELCQENDADLSETNKVLAQYNAAMDSKEYESALGYIQKATEESKTAFVKRIGEVADSAESLVTVGQIPVSEAKGALELLEESKKFVMKDDLENAMKGAKNAYDAAERALHEHFSGLLSQAQEIIIQSKEMGDDVSLFEDLLAQGKSALEKQDYEQGLTSVREALEGAGDSIRAQINATIARGEELVTAGEELNADMSRVASHIEKSKTALESLRFKDSLSYAKRAESEGENAISAKFQDIIKEVREGIKTLKGVGEDVEVPQDILDQAHIAMKDKKYIEALSALTSANEKVRDMQFKSVLDVIAKAKDRFVLAKKIGVDMSKPFTLLNTARDNLRQRKFEDAMKYAQQSEKEIDTALQVFTDARDELVELTKEIKFAEDIGSEVLSVKEVLAETKRSFESRDFDKTLELAKRGLNEARKAAYDRTLDTIDKTDKMVKLGKQMGADITEAEGLLQRALSSIANEEIPESVRLSNLSIEAASAAITRVLSDRLHNIDEFVKSVSDGEAVADVVETISDARLRLSEQSFERSYELLKEAQQKIETVGKEVCDRLIAVAAETMNKVRQFGGDPSDLEILITRAKGSIEKKVYEDASATAREVISNADDMITRLLRAKFSGIKDFLEEAKSIGISVNEAKTAVKDARAKFEEKDYDGANSLISETRSSLEDKIRRYDGIKEKIRGAEDLVEEAQRSKADVTDQAKDLGLAKRYFQDSDFDASEKLLDSLTEEAEKKLAMYLAAKFILTSKESIELAQSYEIDMSEGQETLGQAKDLMKKKEYDQALAVAKRCEDIVRQKTADGVSEMIKELQRLLTDAKNVGVDTKDPETLAEKAVILWKTGDYAEALRCIDSATNDIDQIKNLSSKAAVEIKVARGNLKNAETLDMDVGQARELLDQAVEALTRHQYAIALELAKKSSESSTEVTRNTIWNTLERFKDRVEKAANEGVSVGMAERCVADGIHAFNENRFQDALKLAMNCEAEMEKAELQKEISTRAVEMARMKLLEAAEDGISAPEIEQLVKEAETLLSEGKYVDALGKSIESGDEIHLIRENMDSSRIELSSVREQVDRLKKVGIDTGECERILTEAKGYLVAHDFGRCMGALTRCSEMALQLFEGSINNIMEENNDLIFKAKSMGLSVKSCEDLMEVAKTSFSEKLWDFAFQQAISCRTTAEGLIEKKLANLVSDVRERLQPLRDSGASVRSIEELLDQAQQATGENNTSEAFQLLMEADQRILGVEDSHKKFIDISIAAESAIEILKRIGVSTGESARLLALADLERDKDYDSAIEFVAEALDSAKSTIESHSPDITGTVDSSGLQEDAEGEVDITLKNIGNVLAKEITMQLSGQFEAVDAPRIGSLNPGTDILVRARIVPHASGELPIRVNITCKRHFDGSLLNFELDGKVSVFSAGPPYTIGHATETTKCAHCQGRVKSGFEIVTCRCGSTLHLTCAKRTGQCPVCSQKFSF